MTDQLNLYHVSRSVRLQYGELYALVIAAESEYRARELAAMMCPCEVWHEWLDPDTARTEFIGTARPDMTERVICEDINAP